MTPKPLVLHVLEALTTGSSLHVTDLTRTTHSVRHLVIVPSQRFGDTTDQQATARMRDAGAEVAVVDMRRMPPHPDNARALLRLRSMIRDRGPAVVHGHSAVGGALARLAAASTGRVPSVWTPHAVMTSRPVILAERGLSKLTTRIVAVSRSEGDFLLDNRIATPEQLCVIPNGITLDPPAPFDLRAHLGLPPDTPLVGTVGRLAPQKAPLDFLAMCEVLAGRRPDLHFVMIGDGAMATDVDAAAARWDSDHRFHRVPHLPDAGRAMAAFDVFVLPSLYEGGPYAPLEAMRAGIPVVATDVTGNRDVVIDGMTGYRFPPRQFESAAARVLELLDSPETRADLTTNASARLRENFDVEVMGRRYDELYESLVTSKRAR